MVSVALIILAAAPVEFVLLKPGTKLLPPIGITSDAGTTRSDCCERKVTTLAARFIADEGALIQIETLGTEAARALHCAALHVDDSFFAHELRSFRLRVWVRREDVATVLRRAVRGSAFSVAAGLPVEVVDGGLAFGLYETTREFQLPLDSAAVGITYQPSEWRWPPDQQSPRELRVLSGTKAQVGDGGAVVLRPGEYWPLSATRREGEEAVVSVVSNCATLEARAPAGAFLEVDAGVHVFTATTHGCADSADAFARKGAKVFWPDGRLAGAMTRDDLLPGRAWRGDGGTRCFDVTLQGVEGALPLCFLPRDLSAP